MFTTIVAGIAFTVGMIFGAIVLLIWMTHDYDKAEARKPVDAELSELYRRQERLYERARAHVGEKR